MKQRRIFVLNGHPAEQSLNRSLAESYAEAAKEAGHQVRMMNLYDLSFDPDFEFGSYKKQKPLEEDLEHFLEHLEWSEHFVMTTPMWWGGLPAKLKGLFDRSFLPGRSFDTRNLLWNGMPSPLMTGKTGHIILTSDTPAWFLRLKYRNAILHQLKGQIFGFVGISPVRFTYFSGASDADESKVQKWIGQLRGKAMKGL